MFTSCGIIGGSKILSFLYQTAEDADSSVDGLEAEGEYGMFKHLTLAQLCSSDICSTVPIW